MDKRNYLESLAAEAEEAAYYGNMGDLYATIYRENIARQVNWGKTGGDGLSTLRSSSTDLSLQTLRTYSQLTAIYPLTVVHPQRWRFKML